MDTIIVWIISIGLIAAWFTHIIYCLGNAAWGFLIAWALAFPIGIIHWIGLWFGAF